MRCPADTRVLGDTQDVWQAGEERDAVFLCAPWQDTPYQHRRVCVETFVRRTQDVLFLYYRLPRCPGWKHRAIPSLVIIPCGGFVSVLQVPADPPPSCVITGCHLHASVLPQVTDIVHPNVFQMLKLQKWNISEKWSVVKFHLLQARLFPSLLWASFWRLPCVFNAYCVYEHLCSTGADQQNAATSNEKMQFLLALLSSVYARSACKSCL